MGVWCSTPPVGISLHARIPTRTVDLADSGQIGGVQQHSHFDNPIVGGSGLARGGDFALPVPPPSCFSTQHYGSRRLMAIATSNWRLGGYPSTGCRFWGLGGDRPIHLRVHLVPHPNRPIVQFGVHGLHDVQPMSWTQFWSLRPLWSVVSGFSLMRSI